MTSLIVFLDKEPCFAILEKPHPSIAKIIARYLHIDWFCELIITGMERISQIIVELIQKKLNYEHSSVFGVRDYWLSSAVTRRSKRVQGSSDSTGLRTCADPSRKCCPCSPSYCKCRRQFRGKPTCCHAVFVAKFVLGSLKEPSS